MEDKKILLINGIGLIIGMLLAVLTTNTILLLIGWVINGYCIMGLYFWYKQKQQ